MGWIIINSTWNVVSIKAYSWRILSNVAKSLSYSWRILSAVSKALAYSWKIEGYVIKALAYSWKILNSATFVLPYSWKILSAFGSSRPAFISRSEYRKKVFSSYLSNDPKNDVKRNRFWGTK
jgi:hypothetical protein